MKRNINSLSKYSVSKPDINPSIFLKTTKNRQLCTGHFIYVIYAILGKKITDVTQRRNEPGVPFIIIIMIIIIIQHLVLLGYRGTGCAS